MSTLAVRRTLTSALVALVGAASLLAPQPTLSATANAVEPAYDEPLRIMFEGDSITHSRNGEVSYRYFLYKEFVRQGVAVDFVGPSTSPKKAPSAPAFYLYPKFDQNHAALAGSAFDYHLPRMEEWVRTYKPQVVVLFLGYNDTRKRTAEQIAADTETYAARLWALRPNAHLVLGQITPGNPNSKSGDASAARNARSEEANRLVAEAFADEPRVTIAHTRTGGTNPVLDWAPSKHTFDGIHPTPTGDSILAQRFGQAFHEAGILPSEPSLVRTLAWMAKPKARVAVGPNLVRFAWPSERDRLYNADMRLVVRDPNGRVIVKTGFRPDTTWEMARPKAGRYTARLTAKRHAMVSPPGPVVAFRVG